MERQPSLPGSCVSQLSQYRPVTEVFDPEVNWDGPGEVRHSTVVVGE